MACTWAFPLSFTQTYQQVREQRRYSTSTPSMSARCFPFVVWARVILVLKQKMERVCARWIQCNSQRSLLTGYIVSVAPSRASVVPGGFHMQHHVVFVRLPQTKSTCRVTLVHRWCPNVSWASKSAEMLIAWSDKEVKVLVCVEGRAIYKRDLAEKFCILNVWWYLDATACCWITLVTLLSQ